MQSHTDNVTAPDYRGFDDGAVQFIGPSTMARMAKFH
jgi:hypothetical protein